MWIGVIGYPLSQSLSKKIHTKWIEERGLNFQFKEIECEPQKFDETILVLKKDPKCVGFSVTMPYKEKIVPYLDILEGHASEIGVVNVVKRESGKWVGINTDGDGFLDVFSKWSPMPSMRNTTVVILGAGASTKTLSSVLLSTGYVKFIIVSRTSKKKGAFKERILTDYPGRELEWLTWSEIYKLPKKDVLIINTTPSAVSWFLNEALKPIKFEAPIWYCDLNYHESAQMLIKHFKSQCFFTMNGRPLLEAQGKRAFNRWTM